jgi:MoaA/NifB/PqqE/SkfB family radical SAM enzyme
MTDMWKCSEPYNTVYLEQRDTGLQVAPCCAAVPKLYDTNATLFDQPYLQQIRTEFDNNKIPSACAYCIKSEQNGLTSRRQSSGQDDHVHQLKNLEIHVGNYCNLKCVICKNRWSSAWRKDAAALGYKTYDNFKFNPDDLITDLDTVEWLHFNGGEPLFTDIHRDVLNRIPNPEKCIVYYNTNGTIRVTDSMFELWSKFKLVKLIFSIDDVGERFNYQRTNADWMQVESNMFWYRDVAPLNMMFGINRTISKLNVDHLDELDEWFVNCFPTNKEGDQNDYTNQYANGTCAVDADETQFQTYIDNLNKLRTH